MAVDQSAVQDGLGGAISGGQAASPATALANLTRVMGATDRDQSSDYPYCTIGECEVNEDGGGAGCMDAVTILIPIHTWTKEQGFTQVKQIDAALIELLDENEFTITGHLNKGCFYRTSRFMRDVAKGIRHGITEFIIHVEKAT